jgi:hypothetical protein
VINQEIHTKTLGGDMEVEQDVEDILWWQQGGTISSSSLQIESILSTIHLLGSSSR